MERGGPPQRHDQDPRHRRGRARHRGGDGRRDQRQRHAAVQRRGLRQRRRGLDPRHGAPPAGGRVARRPLGGVVLRLACGHRGRQATGRARARRPGRHRRARQRAPGLPALRGDLPRRALRGAARGGRGGSATALGVHRDQEPGVLRHDVRRRPGRPRHGQHDADGHAAGRRRACRDHRRDGRSGPERRPAGARRRRDRHGRRHRPAAARGHRRLLDVARRSARGHGGQARADRHRPARDDLGLDPPRARAADRRARAPRVGRARRPAAVGQGSHAVGAGGHARGRRQARLADDRGAHGRGGGGPHDLGARRPRRPRRGRAAGHGRLVAGPRGAAPLVRGGRPAGARLDRPRRRARLRALAAARSHALRRLLEVGRHDRDAARTSRTSGSGRAGAASSFVAITDPGTPAGVAGRGARLLPRLPQRSGDRRALQRPVVLRAGAGGAGGDRPPAAARRRGRRRAGL